MIFGGDGEEKRLPTQHLQFRDQIIAAVGDQPLPVRVEPLPERRRGLRLGCGLRLLGLRLRLAHAPHASPPVCANDTRASTSQAFGATMARSSRGGLPSTASGATPATR